MEDEIERTMSIVDFNEKKRKYNNNIEKEIEEIKQKWGLKIKDLDKNSSSFWKITEINNEQLKEEIKKKKEDVIKYMKKVYFHIKL